MDAFQTSLNIEANRRLWALAFDSCDHQFREDDALAKTLLDADEAGRCFFAYCRLLHGDLLWIFRKCMEENAKHGSDGSDATPSFCEVDAALQFRIDEPAGGAISPRTLILEYVDGHEHLKATGGG